MRGVEVQQSDTLAALSRYFEAAPEARAALRARWQAYHRNGSPEAGLRYALALAATGTDATVLTQARATLSDLLAQTSLSQAQEALARFALRNVRERLALRDESAQLVQQRNQLRAELEQAKAQIEQLMRIEQELESEIPPTESENDTQAPPGNDNG